MHEEVPKEAPSAISVVLYRANILLGTNDSLT